MVLKMRAEVIIRIRIVIRIVALNKRTYLRMLSYIYFTSLLIDLLNCSSLDMLELRCELTLLELSAASSFCFSLETKSSSSDSDWLRAVSSLLERCSSGRTSTISFISYDLSLSALYPEPLFVFFCFLRRLDDD